MGRNIVVSINAEVVLRATKEEEKIIKAIENSTSDDKYDELQDKLNALLLDRIPKEIVDVFEKYGFIWGGRWYHYDTMHFEYRPEFLPNHQ